jgi:long-chain acyl-CoA synthetase
MSELPKKTLQALFQNSVRQFANEIALSYVDEQPLTYKEIGQQAGAISSALRARGIEKGDRVALLSENGPRWGITYFAVTTMGAIIVPILPDFHKAEVHHILRNSGSKIVFVSSKLAHKMADLEARVLESVVSTDDLPLNLDHFTTENFNDLLLGKAPRQKGKKQAKEAGVLEEDELTEILYTSGTTGHSKGVMLTHKNLVSNAFSATKMIGITQNDRLLSILPMPHVYECTCGFILPFMMGSKIYYIKGLPTAQTLLPAVEKIKPTLILSVPLVMEKIYKKKVLGEINSKGVSKTLYKLGPMRKVINKVAGKKLYEAFGGELRFMVFGGAATPIEVEDFLTEGGFPYITGYGLTEASPILTVNPPGKVKRQSAGVIVPDVQLRIDDPDPVSGIGEIVATGPNIMQGYYKNEEVTRKTFTADGWLITGDRGYLDKDGYLFIKGRSKNLIVGPSGENIYPEEIEFHLSHSPFVMESLVFEQDGKIVARIYLDYDAIDKEYGTSTMDAAEASKKVQQILEEIRKKVNESVAAYSRIHRVIEQPEEFEKTPTKKIKRYLYTN